jgi:hypothetical protein
MRTYLTVLLIQFIIISLAIFDPTQSQSFIGDIPLPSNNYHRIKTEPNSFGKWLRELPLNTTGSAVYNYRGGVFKDRADTSVAFVVDLDINGRRFEQCMDILVRLYAEYLWAERQIEILRLPLPGGYWLKWRDWKKGFRPVFKGIDVKMALSAKPDTSIETYKTYLNTVYSESHTQQFYHAYQSVGRTNVQIGDVIIKKGTKGHAIMIVDLARNEHGDIIALIGNGDTPACQFFLLNYRADSPWIPLNYDQETLDLPLRRKMSWDGLRRFDLPKVER